jgi:predicted RNase H-like nuclease
MKFTKSRAEGRAERRRALARVFNVDAEAILREGRKERLAVEDVLDALVACWSAMRLARGEGRPVVPDEMTIWV